MTDQPMPDRPYPALLIVLTLMLGIAIGVTATLHMRPGTFFEGYEAATMTNSLMMATICKSEGKHGWRFSMNNMTEARCITKEEADATKLATPLAFTE